jgi:hypothetical protein
MSMITVERLLELDACYSEVQLRTLVGDGVRPGAALKLLLELPLTDARWVVARLLDGQRRARWAQMAAARARGYAAYYAAAADAADAAHAAAADAHAAADAAHAADAAAAYAAADAAHAADAAAAARAAYYAAAADAADAADEHRMACVIGLELLVEQEHGT